MMIFVRGEQKVIRGEQKSQSTRLLSLIQFICLTQTNLPVLQFVTHSSNSATFQHHHQPHLCDLEEDHDLERIYFELSAITSEPILVSVLCYVFSRRRQPI